MTPIVKSSPRGAPQIRARSGADRRPALRRRSSALPAFWRQVWDGKEEAPDYPVRQWMLVLAARKIPFLVSRRNGRRLLHVPPLYEKIALRELAEYRAELGAAQDAPTGLPDAPRQSFQSLAPVAFFLLLLLWHGSVAGWWEVWPGAPSFRDWMRLGALDVYRIQVHAEWRRILTALTLHADSVHLFANLAGGCLLLPLLCRRAGPGGALLLATLGGALGNACNALYRPAHFFSLGFSTALFACLGALSSLASLREASLRAALLPLGAGAGLFAMLGTDGERSDYGAHIFGFAAGLALGGVWHWIGRRAHIRIAAGSAWLQTLFAAAAFALFFLAWSAALR